MAPEFGVTELPFTNDNINKSKEMEVEDIEDGEILEDESNPGDQTLRNKDEPPEEPVERLQMKNNFEKFFHKDKKNHHDYHEPQKNFRRERPPFSDSLKKRKRLENNDLYRSEKHYGKKNKQEEEEDEYDMIFVLGGSLRDTERKMKNSKVPMLPDPPDDLLDPAPYNEGENEDPRPYSKRSPSAHRDKLKKDRGTSRGIGVGLLKRRMGGRGGAAALRKDKPRDGQNDVCLFFAHGKCQRGSECPFLHSYNHPRKLEVCKFYLNDCCNKRDNCIYMHSDFPCKYFHNPGSTCYLGKNCKFSHGKLDEVQRAVLKKYADVTIKELDDMQKYYRESSNGTYTNRIIKDKKDNNPKIPSLFDIKVSVPPEFRGTENILNEDDEIEDEGNGVTTPIPSPQSMMCDNIDNYSEEKSHPLNKYHQHHHQHHHHHHHHKHKILSEQNDHRQSNESDSSDIIKHQRRGSSFDLLSGKNHHKKKSRKSDDLSDTEKSKKHSEKRKKKSKKDDRNGEKEKKKKKREKRNKDEEECLEFADVNQSSSKNDRAFPEESLELNSEDKAEQESANVLSHLPKKQQELFLRIRQHQKEADTNQNSSILERVDDDEPKSDVNWYSSDEEELEPSKETTSPLATLLRTIQTSTNNVPSTELKMNEVPTHIDTFSSLSIPSTDNDPLPMVDPSQLASINISDEVTKLLTSIMKTESASNNSETIVSSLPTEMDKDERLQPETRKSVENKAFTTERIQPSPRKLSTEDVDFRFPNVNLMGGPLFGSSDTTPKDIDLRQLPFKPIPVHDAANEIDASITSHPPMEYRLTPLPFIPRVNYAAMIDCSKACPNDPRFKRKIIVPTSEVTSDHTQLPSAFNPNDPRYLMPMKSQNEIVGRVDPRLADPRNRVNQRVDNKNIGVPNLPSPAPMIIPDQRLVADKEQVRLTDFRDPRLISRSKFPDPLPAYMTMLSQPTQTPILLPKETVPLRKEDPRLRFRANQNV